MQVVMWLHSPGLVSYDQMVGFRLQEGSVLRDGKGSISLRGDTKPSIRILDLAMRFNQIRAWLRVRVSPGLPVRCSRGEAFLVAALHRVHVPFGTFVDCLTMLLRYGKAWLRFHH